MGATNHAHAQTQTFGFTRVAFQGGYFFERHNCATHLVDGFAAGKKTKH
jgi:hypothetical protein